MGNWGSWGFEGGHGGEGVWLEVGLGRVGDTGAFRFAFSTHRLITGVAMAVVFTIFPEWPKTVRARVLGQGCF